MADQARISFMTKEQLESYLSDLRKNRPQRPTGARPLSSAAKNRWSTQGIGSPASPSPSNYSPPTFPPHLTHDANKRESKLLRKSSHKRAHTTSSTSAFSTPSRTGTPQSVDQGWDGMSLQDGRMGDVTRTTPEKKRSTFSTFRDLATTSKLAGFGGGVSSGSPGEREPHNRTTSMSSNSTTGSTHSNSNSTNTKKTVSWDLPTAEAVPSPPRKMPPCHPPPESSRALIEEELSEHFRQHSIASLPAVAPLKITKSPTSPSRTMSIDSASTTPKVPERSTTYPTTREYGPRLPSRPNYVEPHKQEPTQHNKVRYTTNPVPLPSPPMSGSEEDDEAEAEALKELGRRPLPKIGDGREPTPPHEIRQRRNVKKYGSQKDASSPPVIAIVESSTPVPTIRNQSASKPPPIPVISLPDEDKPARIPYINLLDDDRKPPSAIPSISIPDDEPSTTAPAPAKRPLPTPLTHRNSKATSTYSSYSSSTTNGGRTRGPTATCAYCRTAIEGRVVSASSLRFHPECFRCDHCHTRLEHVGFFPEPEEYRRKRMEQAGVVDDKTMGAKVRFYCHLDFHELFSPRCKSCKTPIEGEVVMACGSTWHPGHFFCAECGDPFTKESRFVEKDGYAWCVGCYTKRYSGRCKKCKKPVMETVVKALGGEWHEECFCCTECGAQFADGRFFIRGKNGNEIPVCVKCEERRLKA
ncbi:hypothetical protein RUND412_000689 [Rhizina undulata]